MIFVYAKFKINWLFVLIFSTTSVFAANKPELMLAKIFQPSIKVSDYWVSEKLDGVRGRWNGQYLISRGGKRLIAPDWFVKGFPDISLDGELWIARGEYQQTVSIIKKLTPHSGWNRVKFMVFDIPDHPGTFTDRLTVIRYLNTQNLSPYLGFVPQFQVNSHAQLIKHLNSVTEQGGEGLMLQHKSGLYHSGRSINLLKLKPFTDAEAVVIAYRAGKGQFTGKMGAIKVRNDTGKIFYIGSGFSHQERENPPAIGSTISFRHQGMTKSGIPRFAVFIRVRNEP